MTTTHVRGKKLIRPGLQLRLVGAFVGLAAVAMMLQFLFLGTRLVGALRELEGPGGQLAAQVPGMLLQVFAVSVALLLPIIFVMGITLTFKIAGPVHRFHLFLDSVAEGRQIGPCKIRKTDQLHDLCEAINRATEPLRRRHALEPTGSGTANGSESNETWRESAAG